MARESESQRPAVGIGTAFEASGHHVMVREIRHDDVRVQVDGVGKLVPVSHREVEAWLDSATKVDGCG